MLEENLIKMYQESFRSNRELPALTDYFSGETYSYFEFAQEIAKIHLLFKEAGIQTGDKISVVGKNNPKWCIIYIATITYGAVIVPILQDFTPSDIAHIVNHSESRLLFLTDSYWDSLDEDNIPEIEGVFSLTDYHVIYERKGRKLTEFICTLNENFIKAYPNGFTVEDITYNEVPNDQIVLLNYTSGTTGYSKGVMLTVNNLTGNVLFAVRRKDQNGSFYFHKGMRTLAFLPLAHAYGCAFDFLTPLAVGGHINLLGKIPSPKVIIDAMGKVRPSVICSVPLVLDKIYRKQILPMIEKGALSYAIKIPFISSLIYSQIKEKLMKSFGGELQIFIVGGAPLNQETEAFLQKIGFPITVGYGMTECGPLISFEDWYKFKPGSCGRYLEGIMDCKIDSEDPQNVPGEIIVRGENVMKGYFKNEKDTAAVLEEDGWLHTGDMGTMDADGTIYIKGRCKTMILTSNGQNIYPEQIEDKINNLPLVLESLVLECDGKLYGLVVPDYDQVNKLGLDKDAIKAVMDENLKTLNQDLAAYERLMSLTIHPEEFVKTPKRSIKRFLYDVKKLGIK